MQFARRNREHNYHVGVDCYFYTKLHGFHRAKEMAVAYRKRLEEEWAEAESGWEAIDLKRSEEREALTRERNLLSELEKEHNKLTR